MAASHCFRKTMALRSKLRLSTRTTARASRSPTPRACVPAALPGRESAALLRRVGLAIAVGNAVPEVKQAAHYTTRALPGHGAERETVELVLRSKEIWEAMIDKARA
jgi:hypothetical protein